MTIKLSQLKIAQLEFKKKSQMEEFETTSSRKQFLPEKNINKLENKEMSILNPPCTHCKCLQGLQGD